MGDLCLEDVRNILLRTPAFSDDGSPFWAVGGGGAVKFLLEADVVVGGRRHSSLPLSSRYHKDLDLYVFTPERFRFRLDYPLEIYRTFSCGRPERMNYRLRDPLTRGGFFIEMLHGYYYGFPPPLLNETIRVVAEGTNFPVLSPEYVIASRLFHSRGLRNEDEHDVSQLRRWFDLDPERINTVVARSSFSFLSAEEVYTIVADGHLPLLRALTEQEVQRRFGEEAARIGADSDVNRALISFPKGSLDLDVFRQACDRTERILQASRVFFAHESERRSWCWAVGFALYHHSAEPDADLSAVISDCVGKIEGVSMLGFMSEFARALGALRTALNARGFLKDDQAIVRRLIERVFTSQFRGMLVAMLWQVSTAIRAASDGEAAERILGDFLWSIGWRSWRREHQKGGKR